LILICRKIVNSLDLSNKKEVVFFIFSLLTLTLANFHENLTPFHNRIFIYLIFTLSIFSVVTSKKKNVLISFFIGSLSVLSILFYWDIGTYINFLLIIFLIFIFLLKRYDIFYKVILGLILTWLLFFFLVPKNEFKEFLNQYFIILNVSDYLIGLEFPNPFTNGSTRHTKALLLIVFSGVFLINFIFNKVKKESLNQR
jgi:hypothetical protein